LGKSYPSFQPSYSHEELVEPDRAPRRSCERPVHHGDPSAQGVPSEEFPASESKDRRGLRLGKPIEAQQVHYERLAHPLRHLRIVPAERSHNLWGKAYLKILLSHDADLMKPSHAICRSGGDAGTFVVENLDNKPLVLFPPALVDFAPRGANCTKTATLGHISARKT
jgi:hypothetical protein